MADIVHEAQDTHLCALFIKAHGDGEDYEYALDAANSAAKHLQAIQAERCCCKVGRRAETTQFLIS